MYNFQWNNDQSSMNWQDRLFPVCCQQTKWFKIIACHSFVKKQKQKNTSFSMPHTGCLTTHDSSTIKKNLIVLWKK
jgi:hypothetical protein